MTGKSMDARSRAPVSIPTSVIHARCLFALVLCVIATSAFAQESNEELQKKLSNPLADLVSVPLQYTDTFNVGPLDESQHTLNIQPVYPTSLNANWLLIHRLIVPLLSQPAFTPDQERKYGLGDIFYEGFFSPRPKPGGVTWGAGPIVQMRTATDDRLGSGKWAAGPSFVAVFQPGKWSFGALLTQVWSFAGDDTRPGVSQFQLQPLASYQLSPTHTVGYVGTITANWRAASGERWTVPLGLTYSILTRHAGGTPVNYIIGGGYNVVRPSNAGDWFVRVQVNFVFLK